MGMRGLRRLPIRLLCRSQYFTNKRLDARQFSTHRTLCTNGHETHFGFESVSEEEKEKKVYEVFKNVASRYDLMNDAMSGGIHRLWKDYFINKMAPPPGTQLLDVAGGTGDIAFRFLKYVRAEERSLSEESMDTSLPIEAVGQALMDAEAESSSSSSSSDEDDAAPKKKTRTLRSHVTVSDINQAMLDVGKEKAKQMGLSSGISWVQANAESLPFDDNQYDVYTIAFGIRNCTHIDKVIEEAFRVLKPGGRFMCLEFSQVQNPLLQRLYDSYSFQVIPVMGQVLAGDWKSYQYLVESIRQFPDQEEFSSVIRQAGFRMVDYENLTFGVAAIHSGFKL